MTDEDLKLVLEVEAGDYWSRPRAENLERRIRSFAASLETSPAVHRATVHRLHEEPVVDDPPSDVDELLAELEEETGG